MIAPINVNNRLSKTDVNREEDTKKVKTENHIFTETRNSTFKLYYLS